MEPLLFVVLPGFVGGLLVGLLFIKLKRTFSTRAASDVFEHMPATDVINMAHIRVAGVGGLGLVAVAAVIALTVPRIGQSLAVGFVLGAIFAAFLILRRRRAGPMPSSGGQMGANTMLSIDEPRRLPGDKPHSDPSHRTAHAVGTIPAASSLHG